MKKFIISIAPPSLISLFLLWFSLGIEGIMVFFEVVLLTIVFVILLTKWLEFVDKHVKG